MTSDEVRFAEAVAALTARLESWGVADPHDKAHQFVVDMRRNGWRPNVPSVYVAPNRTATPPPADLLAETRAAIATARVDRLACPEHRNPSTQETETTEESA